MLFQLGRYEDAALAFRDALIGNPSLQDAKVNLELALRKMATAADAARQTVAPANQTDGAAVVLEFIRGREATASIPPAGGGSGY